MAALPLCRACEALRNCLPELLRDNTFAECMRVSPSPPSNWGQVTDVAGCGVVARRTPQPGGGCSSSCTMSAPHPCDPLCQLSSKTRSDTWQVDAIDGLHRHHFSMTASHSLDKSVLIYNG